MNAHLIPQNSDVPACYGQSANAVAPDNLQRLATLHAMLSISYGQLILDLGDQYNLNCIPGDLSRVYQDSKRLADYVNTLVEGG